MSPMTITIIALFRRHLAKILKCQNYCTHNYNLITVDNFQDDMWNQGIVADNPLPKEMRKMKDHMITTHSPPLPFGQCAFGILRYRVITGPREENVAILGLITLFALGRESLHVLKKPWKAHTFQLRTNHNHPSNFEVCVWAHNFLILW